MNYMRYIPIDAINGKGTRCTLFVSGCEHQCRGCYNQKSWNPTAGHEFTKDMEDLIIKDLNDPLIKRKGLSLTGGDPLHPQNLSSILKLILRVKQECPGKDIWIWTGYTWEDLSDAQLAAICLADVLIDGRFEEEKKDPSLIWRGSSNQRVLHIS